MTSHFRMVKMFRFDGSKSDMSLSLPKVDLGLVDLKDLWSTEMPGVIPRGVSFIDKGEITLVYGMESGKM